MPPDPRSPRPSPPRIRADLTATSASITIQERIQEISRARRSTRERLNTLRDLQARIREHVHGVISRLNFTSEGGDSMASSDRSQRSSTQRSRQLMADLESAQVALEQSHEESTNLLERINAASAYLAHVEARNSRSAAHLRQSLDYQGGRNVTNSSSQTATSYTDATRNRRPTAGTYMVERRDLRSRIHNLFHGPNSIRNSATNRESSTISQLATAELNRPATSHISLADIQRSYDGPTINRNLSTRHEPNVSSWRHSRLANAIARSNINIPTDPTYAASVRMNRRRRVTEAGLDTDSRLPNRDTQDTDTSPNQSDSDNNELSMLRDQPKRRKIHHDSQNRYFDPVKYGWKGQVDPGPLRLEIVSCTGGELFKDRSVYRAENVLRDDRSVYCSKASSCTLLFRHQAETSFNIESILIKGPAAGYTSPVQQGIVFIGMNATDLLASAAEYDLKYENLPQIPTYSRYASADDNGEELNGRSHIYEDGDGETTDLDCDPWDQNDILVPDPLSWTAAPSPTYDPEEYEACLENAQQATGNFTRYYFNNTSNQSDITPEARIRDPNTDPILESTGHGAQLMYRSRIERVSKMVPNHSTIIPQAQFRLYGSQKSITMKFDPEISGRYMLLKLFNPIKDTENIDVQFVQACGFQGPRYVPGFEIR